jgi:dTMP kinase
MPAAFDISALAGKFVVFDGPDGCGKTTQMRMLLDEAQQAGLKVIRLREPGGTSIGEQIRTLLLSTRNAGMDLACEMLLYMASRAQLVHEMIRPALAAGALVLSDRYASSTLAYQGAGGGMDTDAILQVAEIAVAGTWPDLTIIFDLPIEVAFERMNPLSGKTARPGATAPLFGADLLHDRIEQRDRDYFQRVRAGYLDQAQRWPDRYRKVDAGRPIKQVQTQVRQTLAEFFSSK